MLMDNRENIGIDGSEERTPIFSPPDATLTHNRRGIGGAAINSSESPQSQDGVSLGEVINLSEQIDIAPAPNPIKTSEAPTPVLATPLYNPEDIHPDGNDASREALAAVDSTLGQNSPSDILSWRNDLVNLYNAADRADEAAFNKYVESFNKAYGKAA